MWSDNYLLPAQRRHRDAAVEQVDKAWASGQITMFERDVYLHGISGVATRGELTEILSDLAVRIAKQQTKAADQSGDAPAGPSSGSAVPPQASKPPIVAGVSKHSTAVRRLAPVFVASLAALLVLTVALVGAAVVAAVSHVGGRLSEHVNDIGKTHLLAKDGLWTLTRDLKDEFGTTDVVNAGIYDSHAVITRRVHGDSRHTISYRYDGHTFKRVAAVPAGGAPQVDFADVDVPAAVNLANTTPTRVGLYGHAVTHLVVRAAQAVNAHHNHPTRLLVYARNVKGETGHVRANVTGKVLQSSPIAE